MTFARTCSAGALALLHASPPRCATAQTQQVYRYVDAEGRIVYSDKPPPPNARDAQSKRIGQNTIETSSLSFSAAMAQERFPVTLYTFSCGVGLRHRRGVAQQARCAAYRHRRELRTTAPTSSSGSPADSTRRRFRSATST